MIEIVQWTDLAACTTSDPELFFPDKGETYKSQAARRICRPCPVRNQCLQDALDRREQYGIWGGTSYRDRLDLLREAS